jgi:hypothetical protein
MTSQTQAGRCLRQELSAQPVGRSTASPIAATSIGEDVLTVKRASCGPRGLAGVRRYRAAATCGRGSFSIRMAVALNSAVPDFGSVASIVSRFVATSS